MSNKNISEGAACGIDFGGTGEGAACGIDFGGTTEGTAANVTHTEETFTSLFAKETTGDGRFVRQPVRFDTPFGDGEGQLPVEAGRYRLIVSKACPWAHRQLIAFALLGITEDIVSIGTVDPVRPDKPYSDWAFTLDSDGRDPVLGVKYLSDIYLKTDPAYDLRFTVPAVVHTATGKIVNNDYFHLTYYWETEWKAFHKAGAPDLFPEALRPDIEALNDVIFHDVNNGVYKAGFAASQEAYEDAYDTLFLRLDELEKRLAGSRYLFGDKITDADIRLFVTLVRFDAAYYNAFRTNRSRLVDFPNLWGYARDLYQTDGFGSTTDFDAIKRHYHLCCVPSNNYRLVPKGPDLSIWEMQHDRR
ncbi:MAG: glutathione S-transferase C-terminal domain-containing protein [Clostridiales Family XIII bacterium]|jgi:putative glutathione S-transferase|nr:glutathione S-transferase C-terminal domain-containing protein [Clostridiales Family XIII bacterium]